MSNEEYNNDRKIPKYSSMCGDVGMKVLAGRCYDKRDEEADPVLLLGKGQPLSDQQVAEVQRAILTYASSVGMENEWTAEKVNQQLCKKSARRTRCVDDHALAFCRMEVNGEIFISQLYSKCARVNYLVQIGYEEGTHNIPVTNHYVGLLHYFVRVPYSEAFPSPSPGTASKALKLAVVSFYERLDVTGKKVTSNDLERPRLQVIDFSKPITRDAFYPVDPLSIASKMCTANDKNLIYCMPYNTMTVRQ
jgi:hypothetical protein